LNRSLIIIAGGVSSRFGQTKGLLMLANKPLVRHILDAVNNVVDEKIIVTNSKAHAEKYETAVGSDVRVLIDSRDLRTPLIGALTGLEASCGKYALVTPCDTPFLSKSVISLLFELCLNKAAAIPRWPNGYLEPLHSIYCVKPAIEACGRALDEGKLDIRSIIERMRGVRYVSTLVLQQLDADLRTFFNINTPADLKKAEAILKKKATR
jgi:molybdopterin-guanine dinucleotide biosynthesis protein A